MIVVTVIDDTKRDIIFLVAKALAIKLHERDKLILERTKKAKSFSGISDDEWSDNMRDECRYDDEIKTLEIALIQQFFMEEDGVV